MNLIQKDGAFLAQHFCPATSCTGARKTGSSRRSSSVTMLFFFVPFFCKDLRTFRCCCFKNQSKMSLRSVVTLATAHFLTQSCKTRSSLTNIILGIFGEGSARRMDGGCRRTGAKLTRRSFKIVQTEIVGYSTFLQFHLEETFIPSNRQKKQTFRVKGKNLSKCNNML